MTMPSPAKRKPTRSPKPRPANFQPTSRQIDALRAWKRLYDELGRDPGHRAVSAALGLTESAAQGLLELCEEKGAFERAVVQKPGPRQITQAGLEWLREGND